jgi:hypothetical protein
MQDISQTTKQESYAMTKAQLLSDLAIKSAGSILSTELVSTAGAVKRYLSNVYSKGGENDSVPIAQIYSVYFLVYDEGGAGEDARYSDSGFKNIVERNPTGSTLLAIYGIFANDKLRERVVGAIAKAIRSKMGGTPTDGDKRVVKYSVTHFTGLVDLFMGYVASNGTIQSNGGSASDSDLEYVIQTEAWALVGSALGI